MPSFSETFFLKTTRPIALISLLVSRVQKKDSEVHGHDCLNCKHQPNVCKFLLALEEQILDTAFSSGAEITIYAPMIYTAPCVMFVMRADTLGGKVGGWGWHWISRVLWAPVK
jgi:hypothetical protein